MTENNMPFLFLPGMLRHALPAAVTAMLLTAGAAATTDRQGVFSTCRPASEWYQDGTIEGVRFNHEHRTVELADYDLLENDAWGAGKNKLGPSFEVIDSGVRAQKVFDLENTAALRAWLVFYASAIDTNHMPSIKLNGRELDFPPLQGDQRHWRRLESAGNGFAVSGYLGAFASQGFFYIPFPVEWLQTGRNEIVFQAAEDGGSWRLGLADYRNFHKGAGRRIEAYPRASRKSTDGGKTWSLNLGPANDVEGEYMVRLGLKRYRSRGALISPVIPMSAPWEGIPLQVPLAAAAVELDWEGEIPDGAGMEFYVRSGQTPFYRETAWSEWSPYQDGETYMASGAYFQWKAVLASRDSLHTPRLGNVEARSVFTVPAPPASGGIAVEEFRNETIRRSAFAYEYEKYDHPDLVALREKFELDDVVDGAQTEFEKIRRLLHWAYSIPLEARFAVSTNYSWNALDYCRLERTRDGRIKLQTYSRRRRDRFCLNSNLVLFQACLSLGITARHVGVRGHEVCEAWSNDYKKWVFLDATRDYYYVDPVTGVPLSVLDLHNVHIREKDWRRIMLGDNATARQLELIAEAAQDPARRFAVTLRDGGADNPYPLDASFGVERADYFRIIPRNNFLSRRYPLPLNHGTGAFPWPWNGYINWMDAATPVLRHYSIFTDRPRDMYPTLNQVQMALEYGEKEGTLTVFLDTMTPNFRGYLVRLNSGSWRESPSEFIWELNPGLNTLEVCAENSLGNKGIISKATVLFRSESIAE